MSGYLTCWRGRGDDPAGRILKCIGSCGDAVHHTEDWGEYGLIDRIESAVDTEVAAAHAAGYAAALEDAARRVHTLGEDGDIRRTAARTAAAAIRALPGETNTSRTPRPDDKT